MITRLSYTRVIATENNLNYTFVMKTYYHHASRYLCRSIKLSATKNTYMFINEAKIVLTTSISHARAIAMENNLSYKFITCK